MLCVGVDKCLAFVTFERQKLGFGSNLIYERFKPNQSLVIASGDECRLRVFYLFTSAIRIVSYFTIPMFNGSLIQGNVIVIPP